VEKREKEIWVFNTWASEKKTVSRIKSNMPTVHTLGDSTVCHATGAELWNYTLCQCHWEKKCRRVQKHFRWPHKRRLYPNLKVKVSLHSPSAMSNCFCLVWPKVINNSPYILLHNLAASRPSRISERKREGEEKRNSNKKEKQANWTLTNTNFFNCIWANVCIQHSQHNNITTSTRKFVRKLLLF
jgi:hypothetical protein